MAKIQAAGGAASLHDVRVYRGLKSLALHLGVTVKVPDDTFALLQAIASHCGHSLATDGSVLNDQEQQIEVQNGNAEVRRQRLSALHLQTRL